MSSRLLLAVILAVALLARVVFAVGVVGLDSMTKGDEADYHAIATNLAAGQGFAGEDGKTTGRRPPLFPFTLSMLYRVTGPSVAAARAAQIIAGIVVVLLTWLVARRYFGETTAHEAAGLASLNPFLTFITGYILTENLYMVLILGTLLFLPMPGERVSLRRTAAAGTLLGLAALARPTGLPLAAWFFLAALILGRAAPRAKLIHFALAAGLFLVVTMPWMIRNAKTFGGWVGLTTHAGITFYQGNNQKVVDIEHYRGGVAPVGALPHYDEFVMMGERERDAFTMQAGKDFLRENSRVVGKLVWWKFQRFWRLRTDVGMAGIRSGWWFDPTSPLGRLAVGFDVGLVYAGFVFPLFVAGLVLTRRRWRELVFLWGVIVVHTIVALTFFGSIRGRVPVEPVIAVFAAVALMRFVGALRSRRAGGGDTPRSAPDPAGT